MLDLCSFLTKKKFCQNQPRGKKSENKQKKNKKNRILSKKSVFFLKKIVFGDNLTIFFLAAGFDRIFFYLKSCKYPKSKIGGNPEKIAIFTLEKASIYDRF